MNDLISRRAAIDAIDGLPNCPNGYSDTYDKACIIGVLEELPSAQPEREKGKWIYGEDEYGIDGYRCDKCGFFVPWDYAHTFINYIEDYNFCPNCGARMEEDDED